MPPGSSDQWYHEGLQFACTQCGNCCTGEPGFVWVNDEEIEALAEHLGMTPAVFEARYVQREGRRRTLRERRNGDCILYEHGVGCTVYPQRPRQCRSWPFWDSNLRSPEAWEEMRKLCPGAGRGRLFTVEEIVEQAKLIKV